jgi:hypothetical protein
LAWWQPYDIDVLSVQSYQLKAFTADDEPLLTTIAPQAAIVIENAGCINQHRRPTCAR